MGTIKCCLLCLIIMSIVTATSGRLGFCPHGKHGALSDRIQSEYSVHIPIIGQSQELRCHFPYHLVAKSKLLWFKDINQVPITNTSDGHVTVSEGVVQVPENMSHSCSSRNTTFYTSVLSIRNFEKADYGLYDCRVVPNDGSVTKMGKETSDFIDCSYSLPDPGKRFTINVQTVPSLTKNCKTHLTCEVVCADCCMCDTDSCRMLLVRDGKMLASTTSVASTVESDRHTFTSTFNVSINGLDDFGRYDCVLRQLVADCVDGSMFENSWVGMSLALRQPEEIVTMPQIAFMKSGATHLTCLFPEAYQKYLTQTGPTWKTWEVVLRKDGKEVASKESLLSPDNSVKESFLLTKCQDFYERYECVIRQVHHGCIKQAWFKEPLILSAKSHLQQVLNPLLAIAWIGETTKHTCSFLVERREADRYVIVVTLYGNKVLRLDVDIRPSDDKEVDIVSANFEIEVKDPTSFGIYNCTLEKNGLPDPSAVKYDIHNMFQITPNAIFLPAHPDRTHVKLGTGLHLPCYYTDDVITAIDKVSQLSWYRNGVQIKNDDNHTTLIGQRFWVLEKLVFFLWCNVTFEDTEAFGTYECRYKDDKNDSSVTLQSFFIEPENWEEQAQELFNLAKKYFHNQRLYEEGIRVRDNALSEASSRYTDNIRVYDEAIRVRDNALKGAFYVLAELVVIVICMLPSFAHFLASWIRQKILERGIRVTLANIQQMEALKDVVREATAMTCSSRIAVRMLPGFEAIC